MNTEQERQDFEAWYMREFEVYPRRNESGGFKSQYVNAMFKAWKAGRATLQAQDREIEFQLGIEGEIQAQTFGPREQAWAEIQRYAAQYAEDGPVEIWEITRRRIEGDGG